MNVTKKNKNLIFSAIFTSMMIICAQISIPLPFTPVPINLTLIPVFVISVLMPLRYAVLSQLLYIFMGIIGLPVFANFSSGVWHVLGPTGGFILGFIEIVIIVYIFAQKSKGQYIGYILGMITGLLCCYLTGVFWFMFITHTGFVPALLMCVVPFVFGDILKIILALFVSLRIKKSIDF